jgi:hypothetical protein
MGHEFKVSKTHRQRGTKDDITIWINLDVCQQLLGMDNRINSILALECNCGSVDRICLSERRAVEDLARCKNH